MMPGLQPRADTPFYIAAPLYRRNSAGVHVLYLLCHYLNLSGHCAYIIHYLPELARREGLGPGIGVQAQPELPAGMVAPLITQDVLDFYDARRITPVVIYPEVFDNPLQAGFFGRYVLNFPGKFGPRYAEREDFCLAYSRALAEFCQAELPGHPAADVLYMPTCDLGFWNRAGAAAERNGVCFYAGKLREVHGRAPEGVPAGAVEIPRSPALMSREEIRAIFWGAAAFYCFEDTALVTEAVLCGCPVVLVPNEFFSGQPLAAAEHGGAGFCLAGEPGGLERAAASGADFEAALRGCVERVPGRVAELAAAWKCLAQARDYAGPVTYPFEPRMVMFDKRAAPAPAPLGWRRFMRLGRG